MKFDDILGILGEFGLYQKRLYILLCIPAIFTGIEIMLHMVFLFAVPEHRCAIPGYHNDTYAIQNEAHARLINMSIPETVKHGKVQYSECKVYSNISYDLESFGVTPNTTESCSSWVYDKTVYETTLAQEMNMVCEKKLMVTHAKAFVMTGQLIGMLSGPFSDMFGRRKVILSSLSLTIIFSFCTAWVQNFYMLGLVLIVLHASRNTLYLTCFIFGMELVGPSKRVWAGVGMNLFWSAGNFLLTPVVFLMRNWQIRQIVISVPSVLLFSYICLVPESPRWLMMKNRREEAERIILKAARVNKIKIAPDVIDHVEHDRIPDEPFWKLFRSKILLKRSLIIFANWFAIAVAFYGLSINVTNLSGSVYLNFFMFAFFEALAYVACLLLIDRIGRKKLHCSCMLISGVACCLTLIPVFIANKTHAWSITALATIGNTGASAAFCVIYVYSSELFPTVSRNSGMATSSLIARIGSFASPYIADLSLVVEGKFGKILPIVIVGVMSCVAGLLSLLLPETLNQKMPETIQDAELLGKNNTNVTEKEMEVLKVNDEFPNEDMSTVA